MLRRLLAAVIKFDSSQKQLVKLALKFSGTSKVITTSPCPNQPISNIIDSILNFGTNSTRFFTVPFVNNMSADEGALASSPIEESIDAQPGSGSPNNWSAAEDDREALDALQESYLAGRQESASKWLNFNKTCHIYLYRGGGEPSDAMAAFDLDGTIIKPKSNKRIPKSATDWQFFSVWTKVKIQQALRDNQARFVIFTNQNGVGLRLVPLEEVQERIELVTKRLNIPCTVFVAIDRDEYRKPNLGMFHLFRRSFNGSRQIDKKISFYCGDAVGYPSHSDADIKFAQTLRLPFLPPEKFLRGVRPKLVEVDK